MSEEMAWAIFNEEFNFSRPKSRFSFNVKPDAAPQSWPHDVIDAAVKAGKAERVKSPTADERRALPGRRRGKDAEPELGTDQAPTQQL